LVFLPRIRAPQNFFPSEAAPAQLNFLLNAQKTASADAVFLYVPGQGRVSGGSRGGCEKAMPAINS